MNDGYRRNLLALLLVAACSDAGSGDGNMGKTTEDDSAAETGPVRAELALDDLTLTQRTRLCGEFEALEEPVVDKYDAALCTFEGLLAENLTLGSCTQFESACLAEEQDDDDDDGDEGAAGAELEEDCPVATPVSCGDVTVAELRACMTALVERDERAGKQVTELSLDCDAELPEDLDVDTPASCKALTAKCPKLQFEPALD
jgi:hypothetical protein